MGNDNWHILGTGEAGDCEDFALTKAQLLLGMGYPASALHIECGLSKTVLRDDGMPAGHAWLVVQTTVADYALDIGHDAAVVNSALKWPGTTDDFTCRRRQIGSNWAFISAYGWMMYSNVPVPFTTAYTFYYILDPILNIFYYLGGYTDNNYAGWAGATPFVGAEQQFDPVPDYVNDNYQSVNFSSTEIFIGRSWAPEWCTDIQVFRLGENVLTYISGTSHSGRGFVDKDGAFFEIPNDGASLPVVVSKNGYYDLSLTPYDGTAQLHHILGRTLTTGFKIDNLNSTYQMPNGEVIPHSVIEHLINCWIQIDTDRLLIHGIVLDRIEAPKYRMYKDGVSCFDAVKAAVGATSDDKILGLAYVPSTDRLN
jgi:hypothetical protein